jgi:putative membrane protein
MLRWLLAALHVAALVVGSAALIGRARLFASHLDAPTLKRLFAADAWWGLAAVLWLVTGLWRLFASTEKPTAFYLQNDAFWLKMGLFAAVALLEVAPMVALTRWRAAVRRGGSIDTGRAPLFARISGIQALLIFLMVFAATAMARGIGS